MSRLSRAVAVVVMAMWSHPSFAEGEEKPAAPAPAPIPLSAPAPAPSAAGLMSKFKTGFYGFIEVDFLGDTTQSFTETPGAGLLARPGSYGATHPRAQVSVRNSRLGFKVEAPAVGVVKASAVFELDLFGNQPAVTEASFYSNAGVRMRHAFLKMETPYVDVVIGQHWSLLGWMGYFHPSSLTIQGLPGQVFARVPQLRVSHVFKTEPVNVEVALAAVKPGQRDGAMPDFHGGVRALFNGRKVWRTLGSSGTVLDSGGIGISAVSRQLVVPELSASPKSAIAANGFGWSIDALVPVISGTKDSFQNNLALTGSFVQGRGINDLFTGLTGGVSFPTLPNPNNLTPGPSYAPGLDPGIVRFDTNGNLVPVEWQALLIGFQYHLPLEQRVWLSGNFAWLSSPNAMEFATPTRVMKLERYFNASLFWDVTPAVRLAAEYSYFMQEYADTAQAYDHRVHLGAFLLF